MKIVVPRDTVGRGLGVLILTTMVLGLAYLGTAWVWWDWNPGAWSMGGRVTALLLVLTMIVMRKVSIGIAPVTTVEE